MASGGSSPFEIREPDVETHFFSGRTYQCYWEKFKRPGAGAVLKWKFVTTNESDIPKDEKILNRFLPVRAVIREKLSKPPEGKIQITWIGHATVLVQFDGTTILADPLFRDFCGPELVSKLGYQRYRKAACTAKDIPILDAVIISHNHYDHLDRGSVKEICEHHKNVEWYVPLGLKDWLLNHDFNIKRENIHELTWAAEYKRKDVTFICVPSQHWCQRGALDLNKVLWCSWVVKSRNHSFYFGGDTGYHGPLFKKIGEKYGPFDLAAIPVGAYNPRDVTWYQHVDPEEAVKIHQDIKSKQSVGIHWGTFELTNEFFLEPPNAVEALMKHKGKPASEFISLCPGETWVVGEHRDPSPFMGIENAKIMKQKFEEIGLTFDEDANDVVVVGEDALEASYPVTKKDV